MRPRTERNLKTTLSWIRLTNRSQRKARKRYRKKACTLHPYLQWAAGISDQHCVIFHLDPSAVGIKQGNVFLQERCIVSLEDHNGPSSEPPQKRGLPNALARLVVEDEPGGLCTRRVGKLYKARSRLAGWFSAVSKPNFASK